MHIQIHAASVRSVVIGLMLVVAPVMFAQQPIPAEIKVDAKMLDAYVGTYEDAVNFPGLVFSFLREGDKFYVRATNQDKFEMYASSPTLFIVRTFAASAEFVKDGSGRVTDMRRPRGSTVPEELL